MKRMSLARPVVIIHVALLWFALPCWRIKRSICSRSRRNDPFRHDVFSWGFNGVVAGQTCVLAMWSVAGSGTYWQRFASFLIILTGIGYSFVLTDSLLRGRDYRDYSDGLLGIAAVQLVGFLLLQIPLSVLRRLNSWSIVKTNERPLDQQRAMSSNLRELLFLVTMASISLGCSSFISPSRRNLAYAIIALAACSALTGALTIFSARCILSHGHGLLGRHLGVSSDGFHSGQWDDPQATISQTEISFSADETAAQGSAGGRDPEITLYDVLVVKAFGAPDEVDVLAQFEEITLAELASHSFEITELEGIGIFAASTPDGPFDIALAPGDPFGSPGLALYPGAGQV